MHVPIFHRRTLSSINTELDQAVKYVSGKADPVTQNANAAKAQYFKRLWCNLNAQNSQRDCCGLLSSEAVQGDKLIVAPIGFPLNKYIYALREEHSNVLEPLRPWCQGISIRKQCFNESSGKLIIARLISDLVRYVNCCHKNDLSMLDASSDNFIIVCRRPEVLSSSCYRFMLQAIDFETQFKIPYNTVLPNADENTADPLERLIMQLSLPTSLAVGKRGWLSGRAVGNQLNQLRATINKEIEEIEPVMHKDCYFDPLLDDWCHIAKNILQLIDAAAHLENLEAEKHWNTVKALATQLIRIAQGNDSIRINGLDYIYVARCELDSRVATENYIDESKEGQRIWEYLCKAVAILLHHESKKKDQNACQDFFSMLTYKKSTEDLLKAHQEAELLKARRDMQWKVAHGIVAATGVGLLLKNKMRKYKKKQPSAQLEQRALHPHIQKDKLNQ